MRFAPIAVFTFKRPAHTARCLQALFATEEASQSEVYIFSDGPRGPEDRGAVEATRNVIAGFRSRRVHITERTDNLGLARSVIEGVTQLCTEYDQAIVLEDDLLVSPGFLRFMNAALERYKTEERVVQVAGYMFPITPAGAFDATFLPFTTSWGWGTWRRAWRLFDPGSRSHELLAGDPGLRRAFDLEGAYPYFAMLDKQRRGEVNSWAIRWYASTFLAGGLTLYPRRTLVENIGFDGTGTHGGGLSQAALDATFPRDVAWPPEVRTDEGSLQAVKRFMRTERSLLGRLRNRLRIRRGPA